MIPFRVIPYSFTLFILSGNFLFTGSCKVRIFTCFNMASVSRLTANHCAAPSEFCTSSHSHTEISSLCSSNLKNAVTCMKLHCCNPL